MKNKTISKIMLLALSVAILIGCAFAFSASAEETPVSKGILSQNIVYGDKVAVAFAVDASIENAENVTVNYYWEDAPDVVKKATLLDPSIEANIYKTKDSEGNDITYPVFITEGVAPKELTKVAHATYVAADGKEYTKSYSAAEYLYVKLYKEGYEFKNESDVGKDGKDYDRKLLYQHLLNYGAQAQKVLGHKDDKLVTDCTIAYTNADDITINGGKYAFAVAGSVATANIEYSGTEAYTGFKVNTSVYRKATDGATAVKVLGVNEISLYTDEIPEYLFNFEDVVTDTNTFHFATYTSSGKASPLVQTQIGDNHAYQSSTAYYGVLANLANDPAGSARRVLKVVVNNGNQNSQVKNTVGEQSLKLTAREPEAGGTVHIVEYDIYVERFNKSGARNFIMLQANGTKADGTAASTLLQGGGADGSTNGHNKTRATVTGNEKVANAFQVGVGSNQSESSSYALLDSHTWYRLRYVYDFTAAKMRVDVSVDGGDTWYLACKAQDSTMLSNAGIESISSIDLQFNTYSLGGIYYVDNVDYTVVSTVPSVGASFTDAVEHPAAE